jgi:hypothetical protein
VDAERIAGEGIFKFECFGEFEVIFVTASAYEPGMYNLFMKNKKSPIV